MDNKSDEESPNSENKVNRQDFLGLENFVIGSGAQNNFLPNSINTQSAGIFGIGGYSIINESPKSVGFSQRLEKLKFKYNGDLQKIEEDTNEFSLAQSRNSLALKTSHKNPFFVTSISNNTNSNDNRVMVHNNGNNINNKAMGSAEDRSSGKKCLSQFSNEKYVERLSENKNDKIIHISDKGLRGSCKSTGSKSCDKNNMRLIDVSTSNYVSSDSNFNEYNSKLSVTEKNSEIRLEEMVSGNHKDNYEFKRDIDKVFFDKSERLENQC